MPPQLDSLSKLRDELKEWQLHFQPRSSASVMLFITALLPVLGLGLLSGSFTAILPGLLAAAAGSAAFHVVHLRSLRRFRDRLRGELDRQGLLERIAMEGLPTGRVVDYIPWPFSLLFSRLRAVKPELNRELRLVASNLDWYLRPPRRLLRSAWLAHVFSLLWFLTAVPGYFLVQSERVHFLLGLLGCSSGFSSFASSR
jgi:hypothetical protein